MSILILHFGFLQLLLMEGRQQLLALLPFNPRGNPMVLRAERYSDTQEDKRCGRKPEKKGEGKGRWKGEEKLEIQKNAKTCRSCKPKGQKRHGERFIEKIRIISGGKKGCSHHVTYFLSPFRTMQLQIYLHWYLGLFEAIIYCFSQFFRQRFLKIHFKACNASHIICFGHDLLNSLIVWYFSSCEHIPIHCSVYFTQAT